MIFDLIILAILLIAVWKGFRVGFIIAVFSFLSFFVGMAAAIKLSAVSARLLADSEWVPNRWLPVISFIVVFFLVVFAIKLGAQFLQKSIQFVLLGWVNKLGGILFYALLYGIGLSIVLFYATRIQIIPSEWINQSKLYPYLAPFTPKIMDLLGNWIPFFKDMFLELEHFFERMSNNMGH